MPRNYERESEWAKNKYKQLLFKISHEEAEKHRLHLVQHNIKPVDWFRYAIECCLVPPQSDTSVTSSTDISVEPSFEPDINVIVPSVISIESLSDISITQPSDISIIPSTDNSIESPTDIVSVKVTKRRMKSPTAELIANWVMLYKSGMSYTAIAAEYGNVYDTSTIRKRILKEMTKDDNASNSI